MSVYLHAQLRVKKGKWQEFTDYMIRFVPAVETYGWKMVGGYITVTGRAGGIFHECLHIWELPDANALIDTYAEVSVNPPQFLVDEGEGFLDVIDDEVLTLYKKQPYSP
jgi:hypothetical protein